MFSQDGKALHRFFSAIEISPRLDIPTCFRASCEFYLDKAPIPYPHFPQNPAFAIELGRNQLSLINYCRQVWHISEATIERMMQSPPG
jgi:hypothetical protein